MSIIKEPLPPVTHRWKIVEHLRDRFLACKQGRDGRYMTWNVVKTEPILKPDTITGNAIGLYVPRETKEAAVSHTYATLSLATEFHVKIGLGDDAAKIAHLVLGEVESIVLSDINSGGLSLNIVEKGNELDVEGPQGSNLVSGIVFWEVQYRHRVGNPRHM